MAAPRRVVSAVLAAGLAAMSVAGLLLAASPAAAAPSSSCPQAPSPGVSIPPLAPRDPLLGQLGLDQAWALSKGTSVTVGVVDTGVDPASPKLAGAVELGQTYRVATGKTPYAHAPDGRVDCDGHGTEVAGIIAGRTDLGDDRVSGIAPAATIYPVAIQGDIAQAPAALIGAAIRDAAAHSTVLNLSFAQTTDSPDIRSAVEYALHRNVVVVAAAANDAGSAASGAAVSYPAAYPGVLAVTAVTSSGDPDPNGPRGRWISIAAPGASVTTVPRGGKGYVTRTGTSFATAIISGAAALLRARFPNMPAAQVVDRLEQSAVPPGDGRRDDSVGYGVVDPFAALSLALPSGSSTPSGHAAAVPVQRARHTAHRSGSGTALGVATVLIALAALIGLATLSVRSGRRRGWRAGAAPAGRVDERTVEPHPAELG